MFKSGDYVVHPRCGVGRVVKLSIEQFVQGEKHLFYEVLFSDKTVWVPLKQTILGIRELSAKSEIEDCRQALMAPAEDLNKDLRLMQMELVSRLSLGTLTARCEVIRDFYAHMWMKPIGGTINAILQVAQLVLYQEWAAIEGITPDEAEIEIETLLERGRQIVAGE
ncbi:MAG: hypothetical protein JXA13_12490 [Anaerolineales bacterium]|nr:hypothetical protein [Anaerolineales bacterium]